MDNNPPVGWSQGRRFPGSYIEDTGLAIIFLSEEGSRKFNVKLLSETPEEDQKLRCFGVIIDRNFKTHEKAWKFARTLMLNRNAENRVRRRFS